MRRGVFVIRVIICCWTLLMAYTSFSHEYGDKNFYLIDSLDLSKLNEEDRFLLDSILTDIHKINGQSRFLKNIDYFIDQAVSYEVAETYNLYMLSQAEKLLEKGTTLGNENDLYKYLGLGYANQSFFYQERGHFVEAIEVCRKAENYQNKIGDELNLGPTYVNLGAIYFKLNELDSSLYYFNLARELQERFNDPTGDLMITLGNLAVVYNELGNAEMAIEIHSKLIEVSIANGNRDGEGRSHNNIGSILLEMGDFEGALSELEQAEIIFKETNNIIWLCYNYKQKGELYQRSGEIDKAISAGLISERYAIESKSMKPIMVSSGLLYELYREKGDKGLALDYYETFQRLSDSLSGLKAQLENAKKQIVFEFEEKQLLLQNEMERKLEIARLDKKQKETVNESVLVLLAIVFVFAVVFFYRMRLTIRQKRVIEKQNNERKTLLKEIHHRVKNNFQIVISILRLQSSQEESELVKQSFQDAVGRIHSMSAVHEMIYRSEDFAEINPKNYFLKLTDSMRVYTSDDKIDFVVHSDVESLDLETLVPLGIAVNELITNSIKYAFTDSIASPKIEIELTYEGEDKVLIYKDNGIGIEIDALSDTFGIELIETVIEKIDGIIHSQKLSSGAYFKFSFK